MAANAKQDLHELVDRLSDADARHLSTVLRSVGAGATPTTRQPRPLPRADIILAEPIMPDDETADGMIETVRRWRREGGHACEAP